MKRNISEKDRVILENLTRRDRLQYYFDAKVIIDNKIKRFGCTALQKIILDKLNIRIHFDDTKLFFKEWAEKCPCKEKHSKVMGQCITDILINNEY